MVVGLIFAALLAAFGVGAGVRQFRTLARVRAEPFTPPEDRTYFRRQAFRRLGVSALLLAVGGMIAFYYLSGMDARMDAVPERNKGGAPVADADDPQDAADRQFVKQVGTYVIVMVLLIGVVVLIAVIDFWATRRYWMARYKELKDDHQAKLRRDLAVYRQQKLNARAKGLGRPPDDTPPEGHPPLE